MQFSSSTTWLKNNINHISYFSHRRSCISISNKDMKYKLSIFTPSMELKSSTSTYSPTRQQTVSGEFFIKINTRIQPFQEILHLVTPVPPNAIRLRRTAQFPNGEIWREIIIYTQTSNKQWKCFICNQRMGKKDIDLAIKYYPQHSDSLSKMETRTSMEDRIHHHHLPYNNGRQLSPK